MSRTESAAPAKAGNLDLLGRLDANVKARAHRLVTEAMQPHERKVVEQLVEALQPVAGNCRSYVAQCISEAFRTIQASAERNAYTKLVDETIHAISDGKPVDLT